MTLQEQLVVLEALNAGLKAGVTLDRSFALLDELNVGEIADEWKKICNLVGDASWEWVKHLVSTLDPHVGVLVEAGLCPASGKFDLGPAVALLHSMLRYEGQRDIATHLKNQIVSIEVLALCQLTGRYYADGVEILATHNVGGHEQTWREIAAMLRTAGAGNWAAHFAALLDPEVGMLFRTCVELGTHRHDFDVALSYLHILVQRDAAQHDTALGNFTQQQAAGGTASA
jgi:hypothetical protein